MMLTEEEKTQRKMRIIHCAFRLFCENGIDSTSISSIAKQAKVSEASIYRYFNTKIELLMHTQRILWLEIVDELLLPILELESFQHEDGYHQLKHIMICFWRIIELHSRYILFSYDFKMYLVRHHEVMEDSVYNDILEPIRQVFMNALKKGKADGSIQLEEDVKDVFFTIWGMMRGFAAKIVIYDKMYAGENPWKNRYDMLCSIVLSALKHGCLEKVKLENRGV